MGKKSRDVIILLLSRETGDTGSRRRKYTEVIKELKIVANCNTKGAQKWEDVFCHSRKSVDNV